MFPLFFSDIIYFFFLHTWYTVTISHHLGTMVQSSPRSVSVLVALLVYRQQWRASSSLEMALWTEIADANMHQLAPLGSHHHAIMLLIPDKDAGRQLGH